MTIRFYLSLFLAVILTVPASAQTDQNLIYGSFFGGHQTDRVSLRNAMALTDSGDWIIVGETESVNFWVSDDALQPDYNVVFGRKGFITRMSSDGSPGYSTFFGGSSGFPTHAISSFGDRYCVGGTTEAEDFPVTEGAYNSVFEGSMSGFVTCFDNNNAVLWSTFLGSSDTDGVRDVCVTGDGIYATGFTADANLGTPGTFAPDFPENQSSSAFISKFDEDGALIWLTYLYGSEAAPSVWHAESSPDGSRIYVYGDASDDSVPVTSGAHQESFGGGVDVGLLCFSTDDGTLLWSTYFGGEQEDFSGEMAVGSDGSVYISGQTTSEGQIATDGSHQEELAGLTDWFLAKFTPEGEPVWATYFGGEEGESIPSLSFADGNLFLAGSTESTSGLIFGNPFEPEAEEGSLSSCMAKFDPEDGTLLWATYIGAEDQNCAPASRLLSVGAGNFAFSGSIFGPSTCVSYTTGNAFQSFYPGGNFSIWYGILQENTLSVNDEEAPQAARLFPNPCTDEVFIDLPGMLFSVMDVQVYDLAGRLMLNARGLNQGGALNTSALGNGIYLLRASAKRKMYTGKLTVTR